LDELQGIPLMDDLPLENSRVLVRVDFNIPIDPVSKEILDDSRIKAHVPTIRELVDKGCKVVLMSHQGRPGLDDFVELKSHAERLSHHLGMHVKWVDDVMGPAAREAIKNLGSGEVLLLDNVRFSSEESIEAPPEKHAQSYLVRRLAPLFDYYINDAFATAHRSHASIVGFPYVLPSAAGRLLEKEIKALKKAFDPQESPKIFVLGGGKLHDTVRIIEYLSKKKIAERILTTGLVAELFLASKGVDLGPRNLEVLEKTGGLSLIPRAKRLLLQGAPIETPIDLVTLRDNGELGEEYVGNIRGLIRDIGPMTSKIYAELMKEARIIVMRGPAGVVEDERFRKGTLRLLEDAINSNAFVIIGGGHLGIMADELGLSGKAVHISTGGGALLILLSGEPLPALEALKLSGKMFLYGGGL
jgi:phosphoglycerate kinase